MNRGLVLAAVLALALAGCAQQGPPAPNSVLGCPEPARTAMGSSPFDAENLATWKQAVEAGASCEMATGAYVTRLEAEKEKQLFANASSFAIIGRVTDAANGTPVDQVCITAGRPGAVCWSRTDKDGWYLLDIGSVGGQPGFFEIFFVKTGYPEQHLTSRMLSGRVRLDHQMTK
jgi:hypothetical protein